MFEQKTNQVEGPGTIVGANVKLSGTLKDTNDITVHGTVEGEVISDNNVSIEQTAKIKGPIKAKVVVISGEVNGEIMASDKLEIMETGKVKGSISTNDLIIKSGAVFNGKSMMKSADNKIEENDSKSTPKDNKKSTSEKKKSYELE